MTSISPQCPNMFSRSSMSNFKPCRGSLLSQLLKGPKIDCARAKVNCDLQTVKPQDVFVNIIILKDISSFDQWLIMIHQGFLKIHQDSKVAKLGFCRKNQFNFDQA